MEKHTGAGSGKMNVGVEEWRNSPGTEILVRSYWTHTPLFLTTTSFKIARGKKE